MRFRGIFRFSLTAGQALRVAGEAREDLRGIVGIAATVPEKKRAGEERGVERRGGGGRGSLGGWRGCACRWRRDPSLRADQNRPSARDDRARSGGIAGEVVGGKRELGGEDAATDGNSLPRIAQFGKKRMFTGREAVFARDLPHHLHKSPGKSARPGFRCSDLLLV